MNKDLILRYKEQFDYLLNGGTILGRYSKNSKWESLRLEAFQDKRDFSEIIINDEYVELRKALAEGKTIQIFNIHTERWIDIDKILENTDIALYKIKPE